MLKLQHEICAPRQNCIVRRQDGGELMLLMQPLHEFKHSRCIPLVQVSGGLIGQQKRRLLDQSAGNGHTLLFSPG
jgi:hypothetical protein